MTSMSRRATLAASLLLVLTAGQAETVPLAGVETSATLNGVVTVVDRDARMLTIKTPDGHFEVLHAPPEVQRLDEIRIGDHLSITQTELLLVDLRKGTDTGAVGITEDAAVIRDPGDKPAGMLVKLLTITGVVEDVNQAKSTVTIRGPEHRVTFKVADPAQLASVHPGDSVSATYMRNISGEVTSK